MSLTYDNQNIFSHPKTNSLSTPLPNTAKLQHFPLPRQKISLFLKLFSFTLKTNTLQAKFFYTTTERQQTPKMAYIYFIKYKIFNFTFCKNIYIQKPQKHTEAQPNPKITPKHKIHPKNRTENTAKTPPFLKYTYKRLITTHLTLKYQTRRLEPAYSATTNTKNTNPILAHLRHFRQSGGIITRF